MDGCRAPHQLVIFPLQCDKTKLAASVERFASLLFIWVVRASTVFRTKHPTYQQAEPWKKSRHKLGPLSSSVPAFDLSRLQDRRFPSTGQPWPIRPHRGASRGDSSKVARNPAGDARRVGPIVPSGDPSSSARRTQPREGRWLASDHPDATW